jgi:tetratricopeptide (TPR) repeat protein
VKTFFLRRLWACSRTIALFGPVVFLLVAGRGAAKAQALVASGAAKSRILLVLPFENRTGQPNLEWIREAAPEILTYRFQGAGFAPMSRADRLYALDHLGLPPGFHPSRATALKLAQTLDADSIVVGSYVTDGSGIVAEAELVDVPHLRMGPAVTERGEMRDLISVFDSLAWKLTRQLDPGFSSSEETFVAAGKALRVDAFEQYIRGISEQDHAERLRHLNQAVALNPNFAPAWMALGREDYSNQQYAQAAIALARELQDDPSGQGTDELEAGFYRGLSLMFTGEYGSAEKAFATVARVLPLAEVVNDEGVSASRQGHDGSELFRKAIAADPNTADYHFNLAVSLKRHGNAGEAAAELAQCLRLRPSDGEAQALMAQWKGGVAKVEAAAGADAEPGVKVDPLERIERSFDAVAFRQAAQMLDQVDETRLAALPPQQRAQRLAAQAKDLLDHGLFLEADRIYLSAEAVDDRIPAVHAGLAEVREKTGDSAGAVKEARTSLELLPTVQAYLVMGRLDLAAGRMEAANYDVMEALKIEPGNSAVEELGRQVAARKPQR